MIFDGGSSNRADIYSYTQIEGIKKSLIYYFRIQAINDVGESELSDPLQVLAAIPPTAPLNLTMVEPGAGSIQLSWTPPADNGGSVLTAYYFYYQKYQSLAADPDTWLKTSAVSHSLTEYTLVGLDADFEYRVRMTAENVRGEGAVSNSIT